MAKVRLACIGGFLGAGKTTAVIAAAKELASRGLRVGIITNDQGSHLIDTAVMRALGLPSEEVTGGCFCCRFDEFVAHARRLLEQGEPDIILAEAVGSCTDLVATVYRPLQRYCADLFETAPLSVIVEPTRIRSLGGVAAAGFAGSVAYLFRKQLSEADLVVLNKIDLLAEPEQKELTETIHAWVGEIPVHCMSAQCGDGVARWIDRLLERPIGSDRALDIDYEEYARAEACLGWLNATLDGTAAVPFSPSELGEELARSIQSECRLRGVVIAHLKILVATADGSDRLSLTETDGTVHWSTDLALVPAREVSMILNARVQIDPDDLKRLVENSVWTVFQKRGINCDLQHMEALSPKPPQPRYRLAACTSIQ